jgi:hypothetical protein
LVPANAKHRRTENESVSSGKKKSRRREKKKKGTVD